MVDVYQIQNNHPEDVLEHVQTVKVIPLEKDAKDYWADEVRTSLSNEASPHYLYCSTRGLEAGTTGYVSVFELDGQGLIRDACKSIIEDTKIADLHAGLLHMWETPTSGGWANAVQPGPTVDGVEYIALTDSQEGLVIVLSFDGARIKEAARIRLEADLNLEETIGAATAVWL